LFVGVGKRICCTLNVFNGQLVEDFQITNICVLANCGNAAVIFIGFGDGLLEDGWNLCPLI